MLLKEKITNIATRYRFRDYAPAVVGAVLINIALFAVMPGMIQGIPEKPDMDALKSIQVIRVKRPDTDVRKKKKLPPKPEKKEILKEKKPLTVSRPEQQKLRLPFKINPKLTAGHRDFSVPSLDLISLDAPGIKGAYGIQDLDGPLTPMVRVPPVYPLRAKRMGIQGWVKVVFLVSEDGNVEHVEILGSEPEGLFESSVINCLSRWRFKPGTVDGAAVTTWAETTIRFELES